MIAGVNGNITYSILSSERPYPWVLYERFEALGNGMLDLTNVQEAVEPWASGSQIQVLNIAIGGQFILKITTGYFICRKLVTFGRFSATFYKG